MSKIPYEHVMLEANKLIEKMALSSDWQDITYWWDAYVAFLEKAGWDPISFDKETAKRVDEGWDESKPITPIWN